MEVKQEQKSFKSSTKQNKTKQFVTKNFEDETFIDLKTNNLSAMNEPDQAKKQPLLMFAIARFFSDKTTLVSLPG